MPRPIPPEVRAQIIDLQSKSKSYREIARILGIAVNTVCKYVRRHNQRALEKLEAEIASEKYRQYLVLRDVEGEARSEWERSKKDAQTIKQTVGEVPGKDGAPVEVEKTETTIKGQCANPAYLAEIRAALADIRKLMAMEGGSQDPEIDYSALSVEDLAALGASLDEGGTQALKMARKLEAAQKAKRLAGEQ